MISFVSSLRHPYAFHLFKCSFFDTLWSDYPILAQTPEWVHDLSYSKFLAAEIFFGPIIEEEIHFLNFLKSKWYIFESCLYNRLENANVFELIDGTPYSVERRAVSFSAIFFEPVSNEKRALKLDNFRDRFDIPNCPLRLSILTLIFYESISRIR